jgi:hypothetical protein
LFLLAVCPDVTLVFASLFASAVTLLPFFAEN